MTALKQYIIDNPKATAREVAKIFNVTTAKVYNTKEGMRRSNMIPRVYKKTKKVAKKTLSIVPKPVVIERPKASLEMYELTALRAEIVRLNSIILYLEKQLGFHKA